MGLLIIDTATERGQIIFAEGADTPFESVQWQGMYSGQSLFTALAPFRGKVKKVAVTIGPGSYTGIRVGMAAAQGMARGGGLPLIGLCALRGFVAVEEGPFLSVIDARGGGVYLMMQERKGGKTRPLSLPMQVALEELPLYLHRASTLVGPQLTRFDLLPCLEKHADPHVLIQEAYRKLAEEKVEAVAPVYTPPRGAMLATWSHNGNQRLAEDDNLD